jgi:hypothetical protein
MKKNESRTVCFNNFAKWVTASIIVGLAFLLCIYFVITFGVNVPFWDEWQLVDRFRDIYAGRTKWWELSFSKHNEHLMGVAYLLGGLLLLFAGFDSKLQLILGLLIQALAFSIIVGVLWRSVPKASRPVWLALSSLICFSLSQHSNLLWAFQTAWFMVTLFLAITLTCLHMAKNHEGSADEHYWISLAASSALLASFTSAQGVIVWFAGAVYLMAGERIQFRDYFRSRINRLWMTAAVLAGGAFVTVWLMKGGGGAVGGGEFSMRAFAYIFVGIHGTFFGDFGVLGVACLGVVMLAFVALALIKALTAQDRNGYALPVALIAFGLVFVLLIAVGRAKFGIDAARESRYSAYTLITYFGALTIFLHRDNDMDGKGLIGLGAALFPMIVVVAFFTSTYNAVLKGIDWRRSQGLSAATLLNFREAPNFALERMLFGDAGLVRKNAEFLESYRLGLFGDSDAIPAAVKSYADMPQSLLIWLDRYPDRKAAILRVWWVYKSGNDLLLAFEPMSNDFADRLMMWAYGASRDGGHYLSIHLKDFATDLEAMHKSEDMRKSQINRPFVDHSSDKVAR